MSPWTTETKLGVVRTEGASPSTETPCGEHYQESS
jgi:hypothetical protein